MCLFQTCHVVYTDFRPTPLQHYLYPSGGDGLYLVQDEKVTDQQLFSCPFLFIAAFYLIKYNFEFAYFLPMLKFVEEEWIWKPAQYFCLSSSELKYATAQILFHCNRILHGQSLLFIIL